MPCASPSSWLWLEIDKAVLLVQGGVTPIDPVLPPATGVKMRVKREFCTGQTVKLLGQDQKMRMHAQDLVHYSCSVER